ncbi:MAG: nitroreductase family protein [Planctomycetes bacterium]|nr:nitroreductase family protein [Planctomycetota bacterium]
MDWKELVRERYSCRKYMGTAVSDEVLDELLEEARLAPSAANRQPWMVYVVREPATRSQFKRAYDQEWFYRAPVILVFCGSAEQSYKRKDGALARDIDVAIAVDHLTLAATARGLGTCWIMAFDPLPVKEILGIPEPWEPVILLPVGYPGEEQRKPRKRKPLKELVRRV